VSEAFNSVLAGRDPATGATGGSSQPRAISYEGAF
jgi:hypothetical protein